MHRRTWIKTIATGVPLLVVRGVQQPARSGTTLILLGTQGGPNVTLTRSETAALIVTGGQPYMVDCGYGALRGLVQAGVRNADVRNIFLTHLHDDHTADLAAILSHKWTLGANTPPPADVYGPFGTKQMVDGAMAFFRPNVEIRTVDEGRTVRPETIFSGHDLSAPKVTEVFRDERVTVQAVENTHFPDRAKAKMPYRSFAYRFNAPDRSIVFSGDTAYSTGLIEFARGADVLVCETIASVTRQQILAEETIEANKESVGRHILETHSSTEEAGKMAAEAKVKTLVLYHLLPGANPQRGIATDETYISEARKSFTGQIIVGSDQMRI
jgi:ribonuclease BN (tRNA processing enzyme)